MFAIALLGGLLLPATLCRAQPAPTAADAAGRRLRVAAAAESARQTILQDVRNFRLSPKTTVGELVTAIAREDQLRSLVDGARQIGGPRWIDDQTCQLRLELPGRDV